MIHGLVRCPLLLTLSFSFIRAASFVGLQLWFLSIKIRIVLNYFSLALFLNYLKQRDLEKLGEEINVR